LSHSEVILKNRAAAKSLVQATQPTIELIENCQSPKLISSKPYESPVPYTYHLNALAFSDQLASKGYFNKDHYPGEGMLRQEPWEKVLQRAATQFPKLIKQLPSHRDYLNFLQQPAAKSNVSFSMNYQ
jgi:hypothetical protein